VTTPTTHTTPGAAETGPAEAGPDVTHIVEPTVACTVCGTGRRAVDALDIGGHIIAVCETCEQQRPTYIRSQGSTARILGLEVTDVRGLLR
jgi:hypothetical protein